MKKMFFHIAVILLTMSGIAMADTTTTTTTIEKGVPTTHIQRSDDPAVGDPVGGSGISGRDDKGPANTQKYCEDGSANPDCARAQQRQTSPTTWQEDCASGITKACRK